MKEITVTLKFIDRNNIIPKTLDEMKLWLERTLSDELFTELGMKDAKVFVVSMGQREFLK